MAGDTTSFVLVITAMILWGSWANSIKFAEYLCGRVHAKFELFFVGFSIGASGSCLLAVDAIDESFWSEQRWRQYHFQMALVAGVIANIGKVCETGAIEMTSMTIALPLVLGIEIFLGTIMLYLGDPSQTNPWYLFFGVGLILMAVIFDVLYQLQAEEDREDEGGKDRALLEDFGSVRAVLHKMSSDEHSRSESAQGSGGGRSRIRQQSPSDHGSIMRGHHVGANRRRRRSSSQQALRKFVASMGFISNPSPDREYSEQNPETEHKYTGIILAICSGLCLATWPVIYEIDEEVNWKEFYFGFIFALGFTSIFTLPGTGWLRGTHFAELQSMVFILGIVGGFMMSASIYLMFASQEGLHFIVSMTIVRCSPCIGAFWGIVLWDELAGASNLAMSYVAIMFILYIAAIIMIALSVLTMEEDGEIAGSTLAQRLAS